ncbi:unnamed protein product, partial [Polarella glacialis]
SSQMKSSAGRRLLGLAAAIVVWRSSVGLDDAFVAPSGARLGLATATATATEMAGAAGEAARTFYVVRHAAKKAGGEAINHGDTVYIKVMTGKYIGEVDGTTKLEWVKARGAKKDKEHALTIEKVGDKEAPIKSGDTVMIVMPNGVHMDVLGSAVRARYYDPRGQWQKITIVKQDGGDIFAGDKIFLKGHQGEYLDS